MTFGYIGYIWALLGCGSIALLFCGSAVVLYGWARRTRDVSTQPTVRVESVPLSPRNPRDAA
jgi:hypothetical protein